MKSRSHGVRSSCEVTKLRSEERKAADANIQLCYSETPLLRDCFRDFETTFGKTSRLRDYETVFMIKIAFVIDTIESPTAGTEKQLLMLLKYLDRNRFAPTLFVLYSSPWLEREFDLCPLEVINFYSYLSLYSFAGFFKFVKTLRKRGFECMQTHFIDSNILGIAAARLAGIPTIISSRRDQGYWHTPGKLMLFRILNRWVHYFVANCNATAQWASAKEGIPLEFIKVIYNGALLDQFADYSKTEKKLIRRKIGLRDDEIIIVIVANLRPVKRIDMFLKAASVVSRSLSDVRFLVVGDGEQRLELECLAIELGVSDKTVFLGKRMDVPAVLAACDIGVLSSDSESFSNAMVEYMLAALPIVATDVGGCREMIQNGVNGYIVPPGEPNTMADQIIKLISIPDLKLLGDFNKLKAVKMFSHKTMVASFEKLYIARQSI